MIHPQLDEISLKQAAGAAVLGTAALAAHHFSHQEPKPAEYSQHEREADDKRLGFKAHMSKVEQRERDLTRDVLSKYKVDPHQAKQIVKLAVKNEKSTFPKAEDILAIIGVESSFKPDAVSKLKHDPAVGLMQVRPGAWDFHPDELKHNVEKQVEVGAGILHKYYQKLHSIDAAVHAYNVGMKNFLTKKLLNPAYVEKYKDDKELYDKEV